MRRLLRTVTTAAVTLAMGLAMLGLVPGFQNAVARAGGGGLASGCPGFGEGTTISMLDSCFSGTAHFAPSGSTIEVSNDGQMPHTFTAVDGSFDSGEMQPGETFELTVDEPGMYRVFCSLHGTADGQGMAGVLVVGEAAPPTVSTGTDLASIREAVAEENQAIVEAMNRQTTALGNLSAAQANLRAGVDEVGASIGTEAPVAVVPVPSQDEDMSMWVLILSGLAVGLAAAALAAVLRRGKTAPDPFDPSAGFAWPTAPKEERSRRVTDPA